MQFLNLQTIFWILAVLVLAIIWQWYKISKLDAVRKHFYSSGIKKNLEDLLAEHDQQIAGLEKKVIDLNSQTETIRQDNKFNMQKLGFVRYNQFSEAGNLSFSIALLNDHDDGFILSSLHSRNEARFYAKDILKGKSRAKLTSEEQQALTQALDHESNGKI